MAIGSLIFRFQRFGQKPIDSAVFSSVAIAATAPATASNSAGVGTALNVWLSSSRITGAPSSSRASFLFDGEWADIEEHRRIRELVAREIKPEFVQLIEGGHFAPTYAQIVSMTPQEVLDKSQQQ